MRRLPSLLAVLSLAGCAVASPAATVARSPVRAGRTALAGCRTRGTGLYALPDPRCTPGALNPLVSQGDIGSTICRSGWSETQRPPESVTEPEKYASMKAYGITGSAHAYEYDHLISIELGGAPNSQMNLWPELDYPGSDLGFYLNPKDHIEDALRRLVCNGKMTLAFAQHAIATDWVAAYRTYG